nr:39S ribosomal protein L49, mitochondrial isoform X2 [Equus asinus]
MAATMFRAVLRGWRTGVQPGCGLRRLSQTQGPPDYPSFVESVDEYQFVERLLPPATIPKPPKHEHYPTASGWQPPRGLASVSCSRKGPGMEPCSTSTVHPRYRDEVFPCGKSEAWREDPRAWTFPRPGHVPWLRTQLGSWAVWVRIWHCSSLSV